MTFKVSNINDLELVYSILREKYNDKKIEIVYNYNTKNYLLNVTNEKYQSDPSVPLDLKIRVIYGDSVTEDTPVLLLDTHTGEVIIKEISEIFKEDEWVDFMDRQVVYTSRYKAWSDSGWNSIDQFIRHATTKDIYSVCTRNGFVKVTSDHSLITKDLQEIKPGDCRPDTQLLQNTPGNINILGSNYVTRFIFANRLWESYNDVSECIFTSIRDYDTKQVQEIENILRKLYPSSDAKMVFGKDGCYFSMFNSKQFVHLCKVLLGVEKGDFTSLDVHKFLKVCSYDVEKILEEHSLKCGKYSDAFALYLLIKQMYNGHVYIRYYNDNVLVCFGDSIENNNFLVINNTGPYTGRYVYDISTEDGRFQAGVGEIIVKNTDSIFIELKYNRDDFDQNRLDTFKFADLCSKKLTNEIFNRKPIEMEFEKVFQPFILLSKKRYIGKKFEDTRDPFKMKEITTAGIALTRRDYCKMVKNCYTEVIDDIVNRGDITNSIGIYKGYIARIEKYDISIESLVLSAQLAKSYKSRPVHVILAEKLKERKREVQIGDRIPYVFIECSDPKIKKSELGEDPEYYIENNLKFNRSCYLEQLAKPLLGFFKVVMRDSPKELDELVNFTNDKLVSFGGKKLRNSDFIVIE
jgi:hypothetical protein